MYFPKVGPFKEFKNLSIVPSVTKWRCSYHRELWNDDIMWTWIFAWLSLYPHLLPWRPLVLPALSEGSAFIGSASSDRICPALRSVQREKDYGKSQVNLKFLHITPSDPHKTSNNGFRITLCPPLQNLLRIKILILNLCLSPYLLYGCETDFSELAKKAVYSEVFKSKLLLLRIRFLRKDSLFFINFFLARSRQEHVRARTRYKTQAEDGS